ncbi:MAG: hypothetical protein ABW076_15685 [Candidatus Thiodiazotropha sp.]
MNLSGDQVLKRLLPLLRDLYAETAGLSADEAELQAWYNRGYADGMLSAMRRLGHEQALQDALQPFPQPVSQESPFLPWGKAYRHGYETGEQETSEVLPPRQPEG